MAAIIETASDQDKEYESVDGQPEVKEIGGANQDLGSFMGGESGKPRRRK